MDRSSSSEAWLELVPGTRLTIVKLDPDGAEAARYPGEIVATERPGSWVVARATWTFAELEMDGLSFIPGDMLLEWFSPELPFNAFAVYSPTGLLRGWYANVANPAYLAPLTNNDGEPPMLIWRDMYLDLVGLPDGRYTMRDEDELNASPIAHDDPERFKEIVAAGYELRRRFEVQDCPFVESTRMANLLDAPNEKLARQLIHRSKTGTDFVHPH